MSFSRSLDRRLKDVQRYASCACSQLRRHYHPAAKTLALIAINDESSRWAILSLYTSTDGVNMCHIVCSTTESKANAVIRSLVAYLNAIRCFFTAHASGNHGNFSSGAVPGGERPPQQQFDHNLKRFKCGDGRGTCWIRAGETIAVEP